MTNTTRGSKEIPVAFLCNLPCLKFLLYKLWQKFEGISRFRIFPQVTAWFDTWYNLNTKEMKNIETIY